MPSSLQIFPIKTRFDFYSAKVGAFMTGLLYTGVVALLCGMMAMESALPLLVQSLMVGVPTGAIFYFLVIEDACRNHFFIPAAGMTTEEAVAKLTAPKKKAMA